jgi:hypothetical protein
MLREDDIFEPCLSHHVGDFGAGEPLLQGRSEPVPAVGAHGVEAGVPVAIQRDAGSVQASLLAKPPNPLSSDDWSNFSHSLEKDSTVLWSMFSGFCGPSEPLVNLPLLA